MILSRIAFLFFLVISLAIRAEAQYSIRGKVVDNAGASLPGVSVLILNVTDSALINGEITDANGRFIIGNIKQERVILSIRGLGFEKFYRPIASGDSVGVISLIPAITALNEVTVTAERPPFEQLHDRTVVNVQSTISNAGASALDVLERSPGVQVDRGRRSIELNGKEDLLVMINGKVSRMSTTAILDMLGGMSSANIDKIELISNPPAKYEAAGNGGIINIQMIKRTDEGTNGGMSGNIGYGIHEKFGASANVNHRKNQSNFYADVSYNHDHTDEKFVNTRNVYGSYPGYSQTETLRDPTTKNFNGRIGIDRDFGNRTVVGAFIQGFSNEWNMIAQNTNKSFGPDDSVFVDIDNHEQSTLRHVLTNLNLNQKVGKTSSFNADVDYLIYEDKSTNNYQNDYRSVDGETLPQEIIASKKDTPKRILVARIDFSSSLSEKIKIETGLQETRSTLDNDVSVTRLTNGEYVEDPVFSEDAFLKETIHAAYSSMNVGLSKSSNLSLGLRYEYSSTVLDTQEKNNVVDLQYSRLFPTCFFSTKFTADFGFQASIGRRISRPSFSDLAPFFIFLDPSTFFYGNTFLKPSVSDNAKASFSYKNYMFFMEFNHQDQPIARFQPMVMPESNQQVFTSLNLKSRDIFSVGATVPVHVNSWWEMNFNLIGVYTNLYTAEQQRLSQRTFRVNYTQTFTLPRKFTFEVSGFFRTRMLTGVSRVDPYQNLNVGIQKAFKNEDKVRFSINNVFGFGYDVYSGYEFDEAYTTSTSYTFEPWIFRVSYASKFGNKKIKDKRARTTGSEQIRERVN